MNLPQLFVMSAPVFGPFVPGIARVAPARDTWTPEFTERAWMTATVAAVHMTEAPGGAAGALGGANQRPVP